MNLIRSFLRQKRLIYALFLLYLILLFRATVIRPEYFPIRWMGGGTQEPILYLPMWIKTKNWSAIRFSFWRDYVANIAGFLPFGGYLLWKRSTLPLKNALLAGAALSLLVESLQYVLGMGLFSLCDIATNALGALLGGVLIRRILMGK